jgi:hypothetical protein
MKKCINLVLGLCLTGLVGTAIAADNDNNVKGGHYHVKHYAGTNTEVKRVKKLTGGIDILIFNNTGASIFITYPFFDEIPPGVYEIEDDYGNNMPIVLRDKYKQQFFGDPSVCHWADLTVTYETPNFWVKKTCH